MIRHGGNVVDHLVRDGRAGPDAVKRVKDQPLLAYKLTPSEWAPPHVKAGEKGSDISQSSRQAREERERTSRTS
jgi:hypothetical protein